MVEQNAPAEMLFAAALARVGASYKAVHAADLSRAHTLLARGLSPAKALTCAAILNALEDGDVSLGEIEEIFGEGAIRDVYAHSAPIGSSVATIEGDEDAGGFEEIEDDPTGEYVPSLGEDGGETGADVEGPIAPLQRLIALVDHISIELRSIVEAMSEESAADQGSRAAPVVITKSADLERASSRVTDSPSEAQIEAGNFQKAHIQFDGFDIAIETKRGGIRRGRTAAGKAWEVTMPAAYGYIKRVTGADDENVDVYVADSAVPGTTFVIDQIEPETGRFDEHKLILGLDDEDEALAIYDGGFSDGSGPARRGAITRMTSGDLKAWLASANLRKPVGRWKRRTPAAA